MLNKTYKVKKLDWSKLTPKSPDPYLDALRPKRFRQLKGIKIK